MNDKTSIKLGNPVVIAQSEPLPKDQDNWGPFQFPAIERMADGRLHAEYHIRKDSAKAYGMSKGHAVSADEGKTWSPIDENQTVGGILLKNGDRLRLKYLPAVDASNLILPEPEDIVPCYANTNRVYLADSFSVESNMWSMERLAVGTDEWKLELKEIAIPMATRYIGEGVLPSNMFWRLRIEPSGRVWAIAYPYRLTGKKPTRVHPLFCVSDDNGVTFKYLSEIPYMPIPEFDAMYDKRGGFSEPDVTFMPDGSVLCLLRITDGYGIGPSYICHSHDGGVSWTKPEIFDDKGVWPTLLTLKCGVTLAAYGRPGLHLRATRDKAGIVWEDRIDVVTPSDYQTDTCSYADLIALDDRTAYIIYSDFNYPNPDGVPVKSILGRKIEIVG